MTVSNITTASTLIGKQIGPYLVTRKLGRGASASVYQGMHTHLGTQVAIKVIRAPYQPGALQQLRNEIHFIPQLHHTHVVRALKFGQQAGLSFLVLEYAAGGTLRQCYPTGTRLPLPVIMHYVYQVADALQYIHETGLIHCDIKPDNMLLTQDDHVLLSDFGIAMTIEQARRQGTIQALGTAPYAAPELIRGRPHVATDQYALASMVYEWICGVTPFTGESQDVVQQQLYATPPALRYFVRGLSPEIENVIMKALSKQPSMRFPSVQAFARALQAASISTSTIGTLPPRRYRYSPPVTTAPRSIRTSRNTTGTARSTRRTRDELFHQVAIRLMSTVLLA